MEQGSARREKPLPGAARRDLGPGVPDIQKLGLHPPGPLVRGPPRQTPAQAQEPLQNGGLPGVRPAPPAHPSSEQTTQPSRGAMPTRPGMRPIGGQYEPRGTPGGTRPPPILPQSGPPSSSHGAAAPDRSRPIQPVPLIRPQLGLRPRAAPTGNVPSPSQPSAGAQPPSQGSSNLASGGPGATGLGHSQPPHSKPLRPGLAPPTSRPSSAGPPRPMLRPGPPSTTHDIGAQQMNRPVPLGQRPQGPPLSAGAQPPMPMQPGVPTFQASSNPGVLRSSSSTQAEFGLQTQKSFGSTGVAPSSSRIDPEAMPRPKPYPEKPVEWRSRQEFKPTIPYPADYPVIIQDSGNATPRVMRMTLNAIPASTELLNESCMPFAVLVQPLATTHPGEEPIQAVDMGKSGPLRCANCKAYVNPFFKWIELGRKFVCNLCGAESRCPTEYEEVVGADGRRRDADERPELCRGSVEFVATPDMQVREPMPPTHIFLIDVSHTAVTTGVTTAACHAIHQVLGSIQGIDRAQVGIATFDSTIHFYSVQSLQGQPRMMVIPDSQEPYCPSSSSVLCPLRDMQKPLEALLDQIPRIFAGTQAVEACATAAMEACIQALQEKAGGKLHVFLSSLPKVGARSLVMREHHGAVSATQPLTFMAPAHKEYRELAEYAANNMISLDLFCMPQQYVDVATLSILPEMTGGQLYLYQPFDEQTHGDEFFNDLKWNIVRPQAWEAVGRMRVSEGLVVERYLGPHHRRTLTDLNFPTINADTSLAIQLRHKDKLADNREVYLQFALLFTDCEGRRRVRVHTLGLKVTMVMGTIFRGADLDSQINFMARSLAYQVPGGKLDVIKKEAMEKAVDALFAYRQKCASTSASGQLILPESLKLLPLYTMSLTKTPAFRRDARDDERAAWLVRLKGLHPARTLALLYPRLFALGSLLRSLPERHNDIQLPKAILFLSAAKLADDGIFLLENGFEAYLHFGDRVEPDLLMSLIGVPSVQLISKSSFQLLALPEFDTPASKALHTLVDQIRAQRGRFLPAQIVPHIPPDKSPFFRSLVEDMLDDVSYVDCLCTVHRAIQKRF